MKKATLTTIITTVITIFALIIISFSMVILPSKIYGDSYAIGDTGPAGGLIFYVDGSNYLEAAPSDQANSAFSDITTLIGTTSTAIGTGQANTNAIIAQSGNLTIAAKVCADHVALSGHTDWFLPSLDELKLMYTNLHLSSLGDFDGIYRSSSEHNDLEAWGVNFSNGITMDPGKTVSLPVRAIRAFSTSSKSTEPVWVRTMPMTCWQVWINEDNDFQFIFWYLYKDNNWVRIYDMEGNMVYEVDLPLNDPNLIVDLPDGFYMVKTFHHDTPIQEFLIGKP